MESPNGLSMPLTEQQQAEIEAARAHSAETHRPTVPALEALLFQPFNVLDHGFVRVIDYMGDDAAIVQAPRVGGCRADPLPDAPPALHAVRDVRDQVPREAADLRRAAVDPPPHGERERVFRALLDPGPRVLRAGAGAPGRPVGGESPGPRRSTAWGRGGTGARSAARRCDAQLRPLRRNAQ